MKLNEYMTQSTYDCIQFAYELLRETESQILANKLYYRNQVKKYLSVRIDQYLGPLKVKCSLKAVMKAEIQLLIERKVNTLMDEHSFLNCL
ncbi:hypothetical protein GJU40_12200 [Bacillus lacus]|uniref:Uncharacterized protein n=1 Tax=Metabacillus lacus TaxID=1983721 RepID=A0A7X2IZY3_9BACI|nr:hypothetical protein [Metabacillus lacus]MRX72902.1 hypothetical protein [Metabacillus lacus]